MTQDGGGADPTPRGGDRYGVVPASLEEVAAEVALLRVDVDDLSAAVMQLAADEERRVGPSRWSWRHADHASAAQLWEELSDFVDWLVGRYQLTTEAATVPPCWYRHPVAVEELTALMAAWRVAYHGPSAPRDDLVAWHDRWLWPCLDRLPARAAWRGCVEARAHREPTLRRWTVDPAMAEFLAEDLRPRAGAGSNGDV